MSGIGCRHLRHALLSMGKALTPPGYVHACPLTSSTTNSYWPVRPTFIVMDQSECVRGRRQQTSFENVRNFPILTANLSSIMTML